MKLQRVRRLREYALEEQGDEWECFLEYHRKFLNHRVEYREWLTEEGEYERKLEEWTEENEKDHEEYIMEEAKGLYQERYKFSFDEDYQCTTRRVEEPEALEDCAGKYPLPDLHEELLRRRIDGLRMNLFQLLEQKESVVLYKAQEYGILSRNGGNEMDFTVEVLGSGYYNAEGKYVLPRQSKSIRWLTETLKLQVKK